jgi:hypothetical protein
MGHQYRNTRSEVKQTLNDGAGLSLFPNSLSRVVVIPMPHCYTLCYSVDPMR